MKDRKTVNLSRQTVAKEIFIDNWFFRPSQPRRSYFVNFILLVCEDERDWSILYERARERDSRLTGRNQTVCHLFVTMSLTHH